MSAHENNDSNVNQEMSKSPKEIEKTHDQGSEDHHSNKELEENKSENKSESMKDEITDLLKPIAIHEAKSAFYKAKLAGYVLKKGAQGAKKTSKFIHEKTSDYLSERKKKKKNKV